MDKTGPFTILVLAWICLATVAGYATQADVSVTGARELLRLTNDERSRAGLQSLAWDDRLAQAALKHAQLMAEKKQLSHQFSGEPSLRLRLAGTSLRLDRSGENVAYDSTIPGAHIGFMHSPPHRANIMSPDYNAVGIAAVERDGYYYVVEDFAHRLPELSAAEVEDAIVSAFEKVRGEAGARAVSRVRSPSLRQQACSLGRQDNVSVRAADTPSARYVIGFTTSDPTHLPSNLVQFRSSTEISSLAVGACFERTTTYPSGVFWVVVALYPRANVAGK